MIERFKPGQSRSPDGGSLSVRKAASKARRKAKRRKLREINGDGREHNGRVAGRKNRLPTTLRLAILGAMEQLGDCSGKDKTSGTGGILGYWVRVLSYDVRVNGGALSVQLANKLLPQPRPGTDSDPAKFTITPEVMRSFTDRELAILERMFETIGAVANSKRQHDGDADEYARSIGVLPSPNYMKVVQHEG